MLKKSRLKNWNGRKDYVVPSPNKMGSGQIDDDDR